MGAFLFSQLIGPFSIDDIHKYSLEPITNAFLRSVVTLLKVPPDASPRERITSSPGRWHGRGRVPLPRPFPRLFPSGHGFNCVHFRVLRANIVTHRYGSVVRLDTNASARRTRPFVLLFVDRVANASRKPCSDGRRSWAGGSRSIKAVRFFTADTDHRSAPHYFRFLCDPVAPPLAASSYHTLSFRYVHLFCQDEV